MSERTKQTGQVILVTGVSSGFGRAMACALAAAGHRVYGVSRRELQDPELSQALAGYIRGDLCQAETARRAVEETVAAEGRLDVLINDAGGGIGGALEDTSDEQLHQLMELNFFAMARMCRAALPVMRRQGRGKIINLSSLGGLVGLPFQGAYSASKYAIEGYSEALRCEAAPFGVSVVLVEPGDFHTGFTGSRKIVGEGSDYSALRERAIRRIEKDETGGSDPAELARLMVAIVEREHPRLRYAAGGMGQRILIRSRHLMGDRLFLFLLGKYYMG